MARFNTNFYNRIEAVVNKKITAEFSNVEAVSACAGISGNEDAAYKAYVNHYGSFTKSVPARRFIDMAEVAYARNDSIFDLQDELKTMFRKSTGPTRTTVENPAKYGTGVSHYAASIFEKGVRARTVHNKLAEKMAEAQINAILNTEFRIGPTYGGDPTHNAARTIRIKGFDYPMIWTRETLDSIEYWTEPANKKGK